MSPTQRNLKENSVCTGGSGTVFSGGSAVLVFSAGLSGSGQNSSPASTTAHSTKRERMNLPHLILTFFFLLEDLMVPAVCAALLL